MSRRNPSESATALLERALSNSEYTPLEKGLIGVIKSIWLDIPHEKWLEIIKTEPVKSILDKELEAKRAEDRQQGLSTYRDRERSKLEELLKGIFSNNK
ncbi:MAG: hypothetical protein E7534_03420 [Ruminococcaceae bacterium]|nr:hypothetical protein [Oscillospiraceae bacterium]